jgi:predicted nuclease with TOPRIM domain
MPLNSNDIRAMATKVMDRVDDLVSEYVELFEEYERKEVEIVNLKDQLNGLDDDLADASMEIRRLNDIIERLP